MSAAVLSPAPSSLIGSLAASVRPDIYADFEGECPACHHSFEETHRKVYPGAADAPILLCFLIVDHSPCFSTCGACQRGLP